MDLYSLYVVRAATKAKTDAKKAKTNAIFGKKIIIAVKAGGPDPDANRQLGELIRLAKANSVPLDVRFFPLVSRRINLYF
jgi:transcriptional/translational regulatory protein YebC/TACO1